MRFTEDKLIEFTYYVMWLHRDKFLLLIDKFLNNQMSGVEFCYIFTNLLADFDVDAMDYFMDKTTLKNFQKFESAEASVAKSFAQELYALNQECVIFDEFEHLTDLELVDFTKTRFLFYLKNFNLDINSREKEFLNYIQKLKNRPLLSYLKNDVINLLRYYNYELSHLFFWTYKESYHKLLRHFINNKISVKDFRNGVYNLHSSNCPNYSHFTTKLGTSIKPIMSIPLDSRAFKFELILSRMKYSCYPDFLYPYDIEEKELFKRMKEVTFDLEQLMKQTN